MKTTRTSKRIVTRRVIKKSSEETVELKELIQSLFQRRTVQIVVFELSILFFVTVALLSQALLRLQKQYFHPYLQSLEFTVLRAEYEETYPRMECRSSDLTTFHPGDLIVGKNESSRIAVEKALLHGAVILPDIVDVSAATKLRSYILRRNEQLRLSEQIDVIVNENRTSFALSAVEDESVTIVLQQIGTNELLKATLESLLGPNPALMELQVITAEHAETQYWHADTPPEGSAIRFANTFVPLYTLLIPLQDTYKDMGPTAVCPGSHRCYYTEGCSGFDAANVTENGGFQVVNPETGYWEAGDGLLYSSSTQHRGTAHRHGPPRVALILSFASPPDHERPSHYSRLPPLDTVYGIRWDHLGYTLDDLRDPLHRMDFWEGKWTGLFDGPPAWNSFRLDTFRAGNDGQYRFRKEDLKQYAKDGTGLMGKLSNLFHVAVIKSPKGYKATEYHAMRLLRRIRSLSLVLAFAATSMYAAALSEYVPSAKRQSALRVVLLILSLVTLTVLLLWRIDQSDWARDIAAGSIASSPTGGPRHRKFSRRYINSLASPRIHDVLVPSAPASCYEDLLGALRYHPGNRRWRSIVAVHAPQFMLYHGLPGIFRNAVVDKIIAETRGEKMLAFLERNAFGDWVKMSTDKARVATRRLIYEHVVAPVMQLPLCICKGTQPSSLCRSKPSVLKAQFLKLPTVFTSPAMHEQLGRTTKNAFTSISYCRIQMQRPDQAQEQFYRLEEVVQARLNYGATRKWVHAKIENVTSHLYYDLQFFDIEQTIQKGAHREYIRKVSIPSEERWCESMYRLARNTSETVLQRRIRKT